MTKIKEIMSASPSFVLANATVQEAAQKMAELDCGFLPVGGENDKLVGTITDRDITTRVVAKNLPLTTKVFEVMSDNVLYCTEDDTTEWAAENMAENQIRRLVVLSDRKSKKLTGVVSTCDIVRSKNTKDITASTLIKGVSQPSGNSSKSKAA